jgi:hypothetical protein
MPRMEDTLWLEISEAFLAEARAGHKRLPMDQADA